MIVDAARTSACATAEPRATEEPNASEVVVEAPGAFDLPYDEIMRATRWWVLYGSGGFAVLCILIGAVEALFGR